MSESTYSQRYASGDSNTAGAFAFDTISGKDYAVSKLAFGAVGSVTYVSASDPLPVTAASLPLPTGAATSAKQDTQTTHLATIAGAVIGNEMQVDVVSMPTVTISDGGGSITVDGAVSISGTVAISAASLPLPSGAATAAKQPAIGTAGTASADVLTVQGIASMTALKVDGSAVTQPVSVASAVAVTDNSGSLTVDDGASSLTVDAAVTSPVFVRLSDGSAAITTLPVSLASVPSHAVTNAGTFAVQAAQSGTWNVGTLTSITNAVAVTDNSSSLTVDMPAVTTGGASIYRSLDLDETEEEVKSSAGTLYGGIVINLATSVRYLKIYDATAANVTVGSTTPVMTIPIPTQAGTANGAGFTIPIPPCGVSFANAITVAATTGLADNDTGAPGANEVVLNLFYK